MIYTVIVRQLRTVRITAGNREQLSKIMEESFKPEEHSELEAWRIQYATSEPGEPQPLNELDVFWRKFPEEE